MPIYEYACDNCGKRSSALLARFDSADPVCPHCGQPQLRRLVSTFATFGGGDDDFGGDFGGEDLGGDDFGGEGGYGASGEGGYGGGGEMGGYGSSGDFGDDDW
jgi:putative FmdB family regulatory protein